MVASFSISPLAVAQTPTNSNLIDIPALAPAAEWSWPAEQTFRLPNGLRTTVLYKTDATLVTTNLFVPAGTLAESTTTKGAASLVLAWLRSGSSKLNSLPLEIRVERLGADVEAESSRLGTTISCKAMLPRLPGCIELLADLVQFPAFTKDRLGSVRAQLATQLRQDMSSDDGRARAHFNNLVFGDEHPAGRSVMPDDIGGLAESELRQFWSQWYRPQLARLVVVGNVNLSDVQKAVGVAFRGWKNSPIALPVSPPLHQREGTRVLLIDRPSALQSTVTFGHIISAKTPKEIAALETLTFLYGGAGLGSRLALDVASKGLILAAGAGLEPTEEGRLLRVTVQCPPEKTWDALLAAANQLKDLQQANVTPVELAEMKARSAALDPFRLETADGLSAAILESYANNAVGGIGYLKALSSSVASLDHAALVSPARLLKPDGLTVVIVGPGSIIAAKLDAAKVRFERVAFEDPVSASTRANRRQLLAPGATSSAESQQARGMIIKALAATGGAPAWRALTSLQVNKKGQRRERGGIVTMLNTSFYRRPADLRVEQEAQARGKVIARGTFVLKSESVRGTDASGKMGSLPAQNIASLRSAAFEDVIFVLLNTLDFKPALPMAVKAPWIENGVSYPGIEVRVPSGLWLSLYFDPETSLLSRIRAPDVAGGESEQRLSDWREINGLKFPFKQLSLGVNTSEATVVDVRINPVLDPKLFE